MTSNMKEMAEMEARMIKMAAEMDAKMAKIAEWEASVANQQNTLLSDLKSPRALKAVDEDKEADKKPVEWQSDVALLKEKLDIQEKLLASVKVAAVQKSILASHKEKDPEAEARHKAGREAMLAKWAEEAKTFAERTAAQDALLKNVKLKALLKECMDEPPTLKHATPVAVDKSAQQRQWEEEVAQLQALLSRQDTVLATVTTKGRAGLKRLEIPKEDKSFEAEVWSEEMKEFQENVKKQVELFDSLKKKTVLNSVKHGGAIDVVPVKDAATDEERDQWQREVALIQERAIVQERLLNNIKMRGLMHAMTPMGKTAAEIEEAVEESTREKLQRRATTWGREKEKLETLIKNMDKMVEWEESVEKQADMEACVAKMSEWEKEVEASKNALMESIKLAPILNAAQAKQAAWEERMMKLAEWEESVASNRTELLSTIQSAKDPTELAPKKKRSSIVVEQLAAKVSKPSKEVKDSVLAELASGLTITERQAQAALDKRMAKIASWENDMLTSKQRLLAQIEERPVLQAAQMKQSEWEERMTKMLEWEQQLNLGKEELLKDIQLHQKTVW